MSFFTPSNRLLRQTERKSAQSGRFRLRHKSTTRPKRKARAIANLNSLLSGHSGTLNVVEIGPGLAVRYLGRLSGAGWPGGLFRRLEVGVRAALPMPQWGYEIYETGELLQTLGGCGQLKLSVLDFDATILKVAKRQHGELLDALILADLSIFPNPVLLSHYGKYDAVFENAVIKRIPKNPGRVNAARNLIALTKPGGIITSCARDFLDAGCVPTSERKGFCRTPFG